MQRLEGSKRLNETFSVIVSARALNIFVGILSACAQYGIKPQRIIMIRLGLLRMITGTSCVGAMLYRAVLSSSRFATSKRSSNLVVGSRVILPHILVSLSSLHRTPTG